MFWPIWIFVSVPHLLKSTGLSLKIGFKLGMDPGEQTICELILCEWLKTVMCFLQVYVAFKWALRKYNQHIKITLKLTQTTHSFMLDHVVYCMTIYSSSHHSEHNPDLFYSQMAPSSDFRKFLTLWLFGLFWHRDRRRQGGEERL